jgi:hypothetical protein
MKTDCKPAWAPRRRAADAEGERRKVAATEGQRLKADALALLESRRQAFVNRGRRALLAAMLTGDGTATADAVRDLVTLSPGIDAKLFGTVPHRLAYDGIIRNAGRVKTARAVAHGRYVELWRLADRAAAEAWLRSHPDLPDPTEVDQGDAVQAVLFPIQETATPTGDTAGAAL